MCNKQVKMKCPRCDGSKVINAFRHYAAGVCFLCNGSGEVTAKEIANKMALSEDTIKKANWVMNSTKASYQNLDLARLEKIRDFCHLGDNLYKAFPKLAEKWFECGEEKFQQEQEIKYQEWLVRIKS